MTVWIRIRFSLVMVAMLCIASSGAAGQVVQLTVPFVRQTKALCGGAAAAMVFRFWGDRDATAEEFTPFIDRQAGGIANDALVRAIERRGWQAVQFKGTMDDIRDRMRAGQPIILLTHEGRERYHYVVAVGVTSDEIVLHDPARGPLRRLKIDRMLRAWDRAGSWALLVLPKP